MIVCTFHIDEAVDFLDTASVSVRARVCERALVCHSLLLVQHTLSVSLSRLHSHSRILALFCSHKYRMCTARTVCAHSIHNRYTEAAAVAASTAAATAVNQYLRYTYTCICTLYNCVYASVCVCVCIVNTPNARFQCAL